MTLLAETMLLCWAFVTIKNLLNKWRQNPTKIFRIGLLYTRYKCFLYLTCFWTLALMQCIEKLVLICSVDLSLKDFPLPNLTEFLNVDLPKTSRKPTPIPRASDVVLPRNQWYYQYDRKPPAADAAGEVDRGESSGSPVDEPRSGLMSTDSVVGATSLLAVLVAIDIIWFIHRMARTYSTARMILYGCPVYITCRRLSGRSLIIVMKSTKSLHKIIIMIHLQRLVQIDRTLNSCLKINVVGILLNKLNTVMSKLTFLLSVALVMQFLLCVHLLILHQSFYIFFYFQHFCLSQCTSLHALLLFTQFYLFTRFFNICEDIEITHVFAVIIVC